MAKLTTKARDKLPKADFAGPGRSYPVNDRSHAANAKARAKQQLKAGNLGQHAYDHVVAMANRKLGK